MIGTMKLPLGSQCVKLLLFLFNLLFVITGIILLSIGVGMHGIYHSYQHFLDSKFLSVPSLLIAIGAIIFFIAFFGCCGAARENYCMIVTFTSLLVIVFILELAGGISGYVLRARASSIIEGKMEQTMKEYQTTEGITEIWDNLQRKFDCCGTKNATDWSDILNPSSNSTVKNLPISCCDFKMGTVGSVNCTLTTPTLHQKGCYKSFLAYIAAHAMQLGGVGIGIAIVQLTGIMIISVGTTIYAVNDDFSKFLDPKYISPATLLIIVGILVFVIAFLGCFGALKESTCMVLIFAVSLSVVLILELAAAITAYALQDDIKSVLAENINATMHEYSTDKDAKKAIDFLQSRLYCCGYNDYHDWDEIMKETGDRLPESCRPHGIFSDNIPCDYVTGDGCNVYGIGCVRNLSVLIHRSVLYIGTGAVAIALIQFTGIMFACILGKAIRKQKTERERRRWELRESLVNGYEPLGKSDPLTTFPVVYMYPEPTKNAA
ncbi:uncharacterized protein LOC117219085 [Megalopta genalis]|uniref:uncharacterized protein LOC117219085 n=1 Tax=Megalopta genalis TaxID=115081 RepID=UPI003FD475B1